jgi:hypothetical protein
MDVIAEGLPNSLVPRTQYECWRQRGLTINNQFSTGPLRPLFFPKLSLWAEIAPDAETDRLTAIAGEVLGQKLDTLATVPALA